MKNTFKAKFTKNSYLKKEKRIRVSRKHVINQKIAKQKQRFIKK